MTVTNCDLEKYENKNCISAIWQATPMPFLKKKWNAHHPMKNQKRKNSPLCSSTIGKNYKN